MTVLAAIQGACPYLGLSVPTEVYGSTELENIELAEIANEAAFDIVDHTDWHDLKKLNTITGTGAATSFAFPSDYARMPKDQSLWSSAQESPMTHVESHDDWLELEVKSYELVNRAWTLLGGEIAIKPTMPASETAKHYYISDLAFLNADDEPINEITADTDRFEVFPNAERVLKLAIIWRWRALKKLDYAEELNSYEMALGNASMRDAGSKMIAVGRSRGRAAKTAYPQAILP